MRSEMREQLVVVVASLLGVILGQVLRGKTTSESQRETDAFPTIGMPTLAATPGLAHIAGEVIGVDDDNLRSQAVLAFATGVTLTYFADVIGQRLPSVLPSDTGTQQ